MLIVAFGESTVSRTQVQLWYNRFKERLEDVNNDAWASTIESFVSFSKTWRKEVGKH